jgi:hypothetical protein
VHLTELLGTDLDSCVYVLGHGPLKLCGVSNIVVKSLARDS